jgi:hypothetical protein
MQYQIARMMYQFRKFPSLRDGINAEHGGNVEFEFFSFFEICFHLRDWILHDSAYNSSVHDVDAFINGSPALRICADICNTLKHRTLTRKTRSAKLGVFEIRQSITIFPEGGGSPSAAIADARIDTERGTEDVFKLAAECIEEWRRYFAQHSSLPASIPTV